MAKHPTKGRRRMGRYIRGRILLDMPLTTLAGNTGLRFQVSDVVGEKTRVSSINVTYSLADMTAGVDIGPIIVGVAHSDYSIAEIEAYIEQTTSWNEADLVSQEVSNRKIRQIGTFDSQDIVTGIMVLNDGKPIKTKLNWSMASGQTLAFWMYNSGSNAIATTVPLGNIAGYANLWPQ